MSDLAWMAVCGLSVAAMGSIYLIDRRRWRRQYEITARRAYAATEATQHARRVRKLQVRHYMDEANAFYEQKQAAEIRADVLLAAMIEIHRIAAEAAGVDDGQWSRPVTVGDPDRDPLCAEISLCGPNWLAVYLRRREPCIQTATVNRNGKFGVVLWDGRKTLLATFGERASCLDSVGLARATDVETITEIIREYNESFHQAKGDADAGVIQEAERGDRDRPGCDGQDPGDPRRQGADRRQRADRGACTSP